MGSSEKKVVLSISLLASNRKESIRKCLDSLKPLLKEISSELIIVDTGCDKELHNLLLEYADKVICFEWCNDFSKARNAGLKHAKGEWFLYIDDDEWFEDVDEIIKFFKSGMYRKYGYANYIQRNYLDMDGAHYSDSWVSRMVCMRPGIHFESKIHEYMEPVSGPCMGINAYVHHYGYVYKDEAEKRRHFERNKVLLLEMLEEEPDEMRWLVQLAQEYRAVREYGDLLRLGNECLEHFADRNDPYDNINIGTFYVSVILVLEKTGRFAEALKKCEQALADKRNTQLCRACVSLSAADDSFRLGKYEQAERYVKDYFKWYRFLEKEEGMRFLQETALLVNETFDELRIKQAYSIAICSGLKRSDTGNLKKYLSCLEWEKKNIYLYDPMLETIVEAMEKMPGDDALVTVISVISGHHGLWERLRGILQQREAVGGKAFDNIVETLVKTDIHNDYLDYIKIKAALSCGDKTLMQEKYGELLEKISNVFEMSEDLWEIAEDNQIELEKYFLKMPFADFRIQLRDFIADSSEERVRKVQGHILKMRKTEDKRYEYFDMRISEAWLLFCRSENDFGELREKLRDFVERTKRFNHYYYKDEVFRGYKELLPVSCQAALLLGDALEMEAEDKGQMKECLKKCVGIYPDMANAVKEYFRLYSEERLREEKRAREAGMELRRLAGKLKRKVNELLQAHMTKEAQLVLEQLKSVIPDDLEVTALSLKVRLQMLEEI